MRAVYRKRHASRLGHRSPKTLSLKARLATLLLALSVVPGCALPLRLRPPAEPAGGELAAEPDPQVVMRGQQAQIRHLEREVERLRADLREAEQALRQAESGMQTANTRAEAVSVVAEARIDLARAERAAPWRKQQLEESRALFSQAERELEDERFGTAALLASRAGRVALALVEEAEALVAAGHAQRVRSARANLRSTPSTTAEVIAVLEARTPVFAEQTADRWTLVRTPGGQVGWIHSSLIE